MNKIIYFFDENKYIMIIQKVCIGLQLYIKIVITNAIIEMKQKKA